MLAFETDLLEYPDVFEGSKVMEDLVAELAKGARDGARGRGRRRRRRRRLHEGGPGRVTPERWQRIESGELTVVGMNRFTSTEPSPLTADADGGILVVDPAIEAERREALERWRATATTGLAELARVAQTDAENIMPATIEAARGATTGEWAQTLRECSARATGVGEAAAVPPALTSPSCAKRSSGSARRSGGE